MLHLPCSVLEEQDTAGQSRLSHYGGSRELFCNILQSLCWITPEELSKGTFDADPDTVFNQDSCPWVFLRMVIY